MSSNKYSYTLFSKQKRPSYMTAFLLTDIFKTVYCTDVANLLGQAFDLLVTVRCMCYHTYTPALSTSSSSRGLIGLSPGISYLKGGFTLRCLQRLSRPDLATLPWRWSPTGAPAVRPSRSSRTKDSSSQISYARAG